MARILASIGLVADAPVRTSAVPLDEWHLWPENVPVWALWAGLQTQWRRGGRDGAPCGLDYAAVWAVLDHSATPKRRCPWVFETLRGMERATLDAWAQARAPA